MDSVIDSVHSRGMTSVTAAAVGALLAISVVAAGTGRALSRRAQTIEAAGAAYVAAVALMFDTDGVLGGVALVLGLAAVARYVYAVISATRNGPARLFAALERESAAKGRFLPATVVDRFSYAGAKNADGRPTRHGYSGRYDEAAGSYLEEGSILA